MDQTEQHPRFVTIDYFVKDMLGYRNRVTYYDHINDPGWPQRVYMPGGKPMLVYDECVAFLRQMMAKRAPAPAKPTDGRKRRPGRPVKQPEARG